MRIQDEKWYKATAHELKQYKKYKSRIKVLEGRLIAQTGPINKLTATYGGLTDGEPSKASTDESELYQLKMKAAAIEAAQEALTEVERRIIELKFFEHKRDVIIYEMYILMSPATFYRRLTTAMKTVKEILSEEKMKSF